MRRAAARLVSRWSRLAVALAAVSAGLAAGCGTVERVRGLVDEPDRAHIGMLVVVEPEDCLLPEGCGPRNRVYDEEFENRVLVLGEVDAGDSGRIVRLTGRWAAPTRLGGADREERVLEVSGYSVLSRLPYHDFLVRQADRFAMERFGCPIGWDKTFAWRLRGDVPYLVVRLTRTRVAASPDARIELWFDGVTGHRVEADLQLHGADPCASADSGHASRRG